MLRFMVNQGPRGLRVFVPVALLLLGIGTAWAGSDLRRGTDGALELQLPVGARGSALGGAVIGDVSGVEAIYWNPAGLAATEHTEVLFTNTRYFADMKLNYIAVVTKAGSFGDLGFNAKVLSVGDVIVTTEDAPEGTGEIISPTFSVLGATWARQFTDRVMFGLTGNYVNERIAQVSASGVAFDFGVQYLTGWQGLKFGMVIKNIGPSMEFGGPGFDASLPAPGAEPSAANRTFRATSSSFEMPSFFSLAATVDAMKSPQYRLSVLGAFQNNNFTGDVVRAVRAARGLVRLVREQRGSHWPGDHIVLERRAHLQRLLAGRRRLDADGRDRQAGRGPGLASGEGLLRRHHRDGAQGQLLSREHHETIRRPGPGPGRRRLPRAGPQA